MAILLLPVTAFSQTAERLDAVLDAGQVTFAQAALVILPAAGLLDPDAGPEEAFVQARKWFPRRAGMDTPIRMGELAHLVMRSFNLSGGFLYAVFPGPRYGYRALAWRRVLPLNPDPYRTVSGEELFYIVGRTLSHTGEPAPEAPPPAAPPPPAEPVPETGTAGETGIEVGPSQGLSSGAEGVMPYEGEFERE
jgi:hypothetical protein